MGEYEKFIFQDLSKLIQSQPSHVNKVAQGITDIGTSVDKLSSSYSELLVAATS